MTHREVLQAMSGLLLGLFVSMLSSTVVSAALPKIVADLEGSQSAYTWVVTTTLLALTVSTPIWGKLADIFPRKTLVQTGLVIYTSASIAAGLSQSIEQLLAFRILQGIGVGGLTALVQVVMADLVSARERGRYAGYIGAVFGVATVSGPLIGGVLADTVGWRACFYVGVPFAAAALVVLQRTLHLPRRPRSGASIDYAGALAIAVAVSSLLIWVTLAGHQFAWLSWQTAVLVPLGLLAGLLAVRVEARASDPLLPLRLFAERNIVLAIVASVAVGVALFGSTVFLSQYLQLSQGRSATESGLLSIPMVIGLFISSTLSGRRITATGRYKHWMLLGATLLTIGLALMGILDERTSLFELGAFMMIVGAGVGMLMQNLVLVVQNTVELRDMGSGSALVAFMRSLGGAAGVAVLGAVLAARVGRSIGEGLDRIGVASGSFDAGTVPDLATLPAPVVGVVEHAYGVGVADVFMFAAPVAFIALVAVALLDEVPLGTRSGIEAARDAADTSPEPAPRA